MYAEDPSNGFLPQAGAVLLYREPRGPGIRVDSGIGEGDIVSVHYDPLLAKLIVSAETRAAALARADRALGEFAILGIVTNIPLLRALVRHPDVRAGRIDTGLLGRLMPSLLPPSADAAGGCGGCRRRARLAAWSASGRRPGRVRATRPLDRASGMAALTWRHVPSTSASATRSCVSTRWPTARCRPAARRLVSKPSPSASGAWSSTAPRTRCLPAGPADAPWIWLDGVVYRPEVADSERPARTRSRDTSGSLSAPMPATVRAIAIAPGDRVSRGDTLIVLEAMKMELPLKSPVDGVVASVACQVGDLVQPGIPLVELA